MNIGIFKKNNNNNKKKEKKRREAINLPPKERNLTSHVGKYNCEWINELHFMDEIKLLDDYYYYYY